MAVSGIFIFATLWFMGTGRFPSVTELVLLLIFTANGVAAYYCILGNASAMYALMAFKGVFFLFMPAMIFVILLWAFLLLWYTSSKEYFNRIKLEGGTGIPAGKEILKHIAAGIIGIVLLVALIGAVQNRNKGSRSGMTEPEITTSIETPANITLKSGRETYNNMMKIAELILGYYEKNKSLPLNNSPIMSQYLVDEWNAEIIYEYDSNGAIYSMRSLGEDGAYGTEDDIYMYDFIPPDNYVPDAAKK